MTQDQSQPPLTSPVRVRQLLDELGMRPSRALGQNFLIDRNVLDILLEAADLCASDAVLEVGPGLGVVTDALLSRAGRVVAIEKDIRLCGHLAQRFAGNARFQLRCGDAVDLVLPELEHRDITRFVSNLPYSAGSRILVNISLAGSIPIMVVTVQQEVADRLAAGPATPDYGLLSVWMQLDYDVEIVKRVRPTCFWPQPEVNSAIVRLCRRPDREDDSVETRRLFRWVTRRAFTHRRKQLAVALGDTAATRGLIRSRLLEPLGLDPKARAETVDVSGWWAIARALTSMPMEGISAVDDRQDNQP
jgi:16S rRNA (adenine1518-N6/adenine1519-N6)-dimethyltransferase